MLCLFQLVCAQHSFTLQRVEAMHFTRLIDKHIKMSLNVCSFNVAVSGVLTRMRQVEENISPKLFLRSCIQLANTTGFILRVTVEFEALGVKCNTLSDHRARHTPRVARFCSGVHKLLDILCMNIY